MTDETNAPIEIHQDVLEFEKGNPLSLTTKALIFQATVSAVMLGFALHGLTIESGPASNLKIALLTIASGVIAFVVNKIAIEQGADHAARKSRLAAISSILAILSVGVGFYMLTYSGQVNVEVGELQAQEHATDLSLYTGEQYEFASAASRAGSTIRHIQTDLSQKVLCENQSSCISNRGDGGHGTVAIALEKLAARANGIANQFELGETNRSVALDKINDLMVEYQETLSRTGKSIWDRRGTLQQIDAAVDQEVTRLLESVPVSTLTIYAEELLSGVTIPSRPGITQRLNAILRSHGDNLDKILGAIDISDLERPVFPPRPGILDSFKYLRNFISVAMLTFMVELVLPMSIWIATYLDRVLEIQREKHRRQQLKASERIGDNTPAPKATRKERLNGYRKPKHSKQMPNGAARRNGRTN